jgi:hypothetical protein
MGAWKIGQRDLAILYFTADITQHLDFDLVAHRLYIYQPGRQNHGQDDQQGKHHKNSDQPDGSFFDFAHSGSCIFHFSSRASVAAADKIKKSGEKYLASVATPHSKLRGAQSSRNQARKPIKVPKSNNRPLVGQVEFL